MRPSEAAAGPATRALRLLLAALVACAGAQSGATAPAPPALRVAVDASLADRAACVAAGVALLAAAGVRVDLATTADPRAVVIVRARATTTCAPAGVWLPQQRTIALDPACVPTTAACAALLAHECAHALGMRHTDPVRSPGVFNPIVPPDTTLSPGDRAELARVGAVRR